MEMSSAGGGSSWARRWGSSAARWPENKRRPRASRRTRSIVANKRDDGWWTDKTAERPVVAHTSRSNAATSRAEDASRPEVGSSTRSTAGAEARRIARETRRRSPPERPAAPAVRPPMRLCFTLGGRAGELGN
eukprot:scaffold66729_cov33-Tisochrysis_lutea.AAC.5